jgi:hypothetical protein
VGMTGMLLRGHRHRGGAELAKARLEFFADAKGELEDCALAWEGSEQLRQLLPLLLVDEWLKTTSATCRAARAGC